jgi:NADH:ubiquinone oxidoreductase subunit 3 (subunit A)
MSLNPWIFIGLFFAVGWILPFTPVALGWLLSPKRPNSVKQEPYECGVEMVGSPWAQFRAQWYVFALVFVVFDVELIFLFPWALAYNSLGLFALFEVFVFVGLLLVALWYVVRKDALEWS